MKRTSFRRAIVPGIAALAIALSGCGAGNESDNGGSDSGSDGGSNSLSGTLAGGGASSQEKAQAAWRAGFQGDHPDVTVNYDPVGSGTGRENFISEAYAFAGTDAALSDDEITAAKERCGGEDAIEIPAYVSPIAVIYNLPDVPDLQLDAKTIAEIFSGKITTWDDKAIADQNPDATLPSSTITPVHRQDDSGTTENFTAYLSDAGEGAWTAEPDGLWPGDIKGGEAADGTSGVVGAVQGGEGTIGYADHSAAADLGVVKVKVGDSYNEPTAEGAAKVVAVSPRVEGRPEVDMAVELDRSSTEADVYPVVLVSYMIACQHYGDATEADLVKSFLSYVVSDEGQQAAADEAGSAPLEAGLAEEAAGIVDKIAAK